jgi:DNA-binding NarL/FixJ family response regulator
MCTCEESTAHRVLLVGPFPVVLGSLACLLGTTGHYEADVVSREDAALRRVTEWDPDVVVLHRAAPHSIRRIVAQVRRERREARVMVLAEDMGQAAVVAAVDAGAVGHIPADAPFDSMVAAVDDVLHVGASLDPVSAAALVRLRSNAPVTDEISPREREALVLVASGLANKQIAARMGITDRTVKAHLSRVFQRIGASNRTEAALWARRTGLLEPLPLAS